MTAKDYIDEVKLRLPRYNVGTKLSDAKILTYINQARREVQRMTIGLYPERYSKVLFLYIEKELYDPTLQLSSTYHGRPIKVYRVALPDFFLDSSVAILTYMNSNGNTIRVQARRMTKKEMFSVQMTSWNYPSISSPAYSIEYKMLDMANPSGTGKWLYIAGLETSETETIFDKGYTRVGIEVWCTTVLDDLELGIMAINQSIASDSEYVIPVDMEELVINHAIMYCMQNETPQLDRDSIKAYIDSQYMILESNTKIIEEKTISLLPSQETP
jgi:hypothetical protein